MNGCIDVTSQVGVGSTFSISVQLLPADTQKPTVVAPELNRSAVMIVAAAEIEASLLARRLGRWGASTCAVIDGKIAAALLPERSWDALLIDYPIARAMTENCDLTRLHIPKRIAMIRPSERHELQALKAAGFTGYLVKPVRAASLAARLAVTDTFEHSASEVAQNQPRTLRLHPVKGLSILVAEDNEINALLARALLTQLGRGSPHRRKR